jgi:hypothetical protein
MLQKEKIKKVMPNGDAMTGQPFNLNFWMKHF